MLPTAATMVPIFGERSNVSAKARIVVPVPWIPFIIVVEVSILTYVCVYLELLRCQMTVVFFLLAWRKFQKQLVL